MTTLTITAKNTRSAAAADAGVDVSAVTANTWTLFLRIWSNSMSGSQRARINFEDTVDNFTTTLQGPVRCIVPVVNVAEGRTYSWRWREFDDLRIGTSSAKLRTNLTRITGGNVTYESWLAY